MLRTKLIAAGSGAVVVAGVGVALFVGPAFGQAGGTTTSSTVTTSTSKPNTAPTTTACKKSYPPATPTLTIAASPTTVVSGRSTTLSGSLSTLGCVLSKESITLHGTNSSGDLAFTTVTTAKDGTYSFTFAPPVTASYYAVFDGDGTFSPAQSGTVTVTVTRK